LNLQIPVGINYECSGCGQCCLGWPVPVTEEDYQRLSSLSPDDLELPAGEKPIFRDLQSPDENKKIFTHMLGKRSDGRCQFLNQENRCALHLKHGEEMKPAMCRLFPYSFTEAPGGVFASVSFVSTGALINHGRPLTEQAALLEQKWELFKSLFPEGGRDWSDIRIIDGFPISWEDYMQLDQKLIELIGSTEQRRIEKRLDDCSRYLITQLPRTATLERVPQIKTRQKLVDQLLMKRLFELYMTDDPFACSVGDLYSEAFLADISEPPQAVQIEFAGTGIGFNQLFAFTLGELDGESEDLLARFVYNRIFGKLYFGAGYAGFSVLAGIHHLMHLICLIKLKVKLICLAQNRKNLDFLEIAEIVRTLERRLTEVSFTSEPARVLDLFLTSSERSQRIQALTA